mgnify:CR=1 FL=1
MRSCDNPVRSNKRSSTSEPATKKKNDLKRRDKQFAISKRKIITWKKYREKRKGERNDPAWLLGVQTAAGKIATLAKLARAITRAIVETPHVTGPGGPVRNGK